MVLKRLVALAGSGLEMEMEGLVQEFDPVELAEKLLLAEHLLWLEADGFHSVGRELLKGFVPFPQKKL